MALNSWNIKRIHYVIRHSKVEKKTKLYYYTYAAFEVLSMFRILQLCKGGECYNLRLLQRFLCVLKP